MAHTFIFHQPLLHSPLRRCKSTKQFPRIAKACEKLKPNTLVDGEIVALDGNGIKSQLATDPATPRAIDINGEVSFAVRARLGQLQNVQRERRRRLHRVRIH